METIDYISRIETHQKGADDRIFEGYASVFGAPVRTWIPTKVDKGAFKRSLKENGGRVKLLNQHLIEEPIGKPIGLRETETGLFVEGKISKTQVGNDVWTLMQDGVLDSLSIGFNPIQTHNEVVDGETWRHITELDLMEISIVTFPADSAATIRSMHGIQLFDSHDARLSELEKLRLYFDRLRAAELPNFEERFGGDWIF